MEINKEQKTITLTLDELEKLYEGAETIEEKLHPSFATPYRMGRNSLVLELIGKIKPDYDSN